MESNPTPPAAPAETPDADQAFPRLSDDQIELLFSEGERRAARNEVLFREGDVARAAIPSCWRPAHEACSPPATGEAIKRMASAVGEGSMAVRLVHEHLGSHNRQRAEGRRAQG